MSKVSEKEILRIKKSGLFDEGWYLEKYPDVEAVGINPLEHFIKYGADLKRDPGPDFSTIFYSGICPHPFKKKINPLLYSINTEDKNINNKAILWSAFNLALHKSDYSAAIKLAKKYLPKELKYTAEALRVNKFRDEGRNDEWLNSINLYLKNFELEPLSLKSEKHLIGRFCTKELPVVKGGPLISVIMPAWNAEKTIGYAINSILNQTWQNLELIVVDDCSNDGTWNVIKSFEKLDNRVKTVKNKVNVGPYVSKNIGLKQSNGAYITGHDADDWAHPQRLEKHVENIKKSGFPRASVEHMIRLKPDGLFGNLDKISNFSFDGVARRASISCMFEASFMHKKLGFWDSVRFGADSEMIARVESILGDEFKIFNTVGMICLDDEASLTNHPIHGIRANNGKLSNSRSLYRDSWRDWHHSSMSDENTYLDFPLRKRRYYAQELMVVPYGKQLLNL